MHLLGLDLTSRSVRAVIVDDKGAVLRRSERTGADLASMLGEVFGEIGGSKPRAIGLAADLESEDLDAITHALLKSRPPHRCKPGAAAVVAEAWVGAARGAKHAVCLTIGERVLAGILLNGKSWAGAHGLAGSAAWLALNPVERQDYRKFGSLAAEVSNKGIARRLAWRIQAGDNSAVLERAGDLESITAAHVFDGARTGDGVSISVVRDTAKYIGMAVSNLASTIDPEIVVLGGTAAAAGDLLLEPIRQECARRLSPAMFAKVRIEISPLAENGVAIGAARLAAPVRA
jgi:predicted NBD/HSP70 family sugar kinase